MGKGNKKQVTIGHNSSFSPIFQKDDISNIIFDFFSNSVSGTCSRRNELLSAKKYGLFPETAFPSRLHISVSKISNIFI